MRYQEDVPQRLTEDSVLGKDQPGRIRMFEFPGLDADHPTHSQLLKMVQGNILKSHGRNYSTFTLLRFPSHKARLQELREWIRRLPVTSALAQLRGAEKYRSDGVSDDPFVGFYLSASGYRALGYGRALPQDPAFRGGMKSAGSRLFDLNANHWEAKYQDRIDALLLVADDDEARLSRFTSSCQRDLAAFAEEVGIEQGCVIRNSHGESIEHFGYVDGISNPLFLKHDIERFASTVSLPVWDPTANPFHLVLANDPHVRGEFGSYLVFRKLEQDIAGFSAHCSHLGAAIGDSSDRAGAMVIGRNQNGTPVAGSIDLGSPRDDLNNFIYDDGGSNHLACPFQAHVRKMNPRVDDPMARARRIARRGIAYGTDNNKPADAGVGKQVTNSCGLLFLCFQQDIGRQFEFLQRMWANREDFPEPLRHAGIDPVIGQFRRYHTSPRAQLWPKRDGRVVRYPFWGYVRLRGGEYFFAPSLSFLVRC